MTHQPVMPDETLAALAPRAAGVYLDATFGRGGHSARLLDDLGPDGRLYALDLDPEAVSAGRQRFGDDARFVIEQGSFAHLARWAARWGVTGRFDGILMDLGVSSPQLDDPARGFSFAHDGPLDMRLDPGAGDSAADWLERVEEKDLARVLKEYGEERFARRIARAICHARREAPITTTGRLSEIVARAVPTREPGKHPATRCFQAIRIHINRELEALEAALEQSVDLLAPGGRLVVIAFHSLEDRRVNRFMRDESGGAPRPRRLPVMGQPERRLRRLGKPVMAGAEEIGRNPRSRSAVLRAAERL
jgi:16S rRNA (cytosine1402-N4)-methyltransferase